MFTDLTTARKHALGLARNLMVITMVVVAGAHFTVITADDHDPSLTIVNEYDPFA
ncbi:MULTISPECIES: hypothetical protein [Sphingobium]|uniref:hypothetical protein n=1 Tax=Sphingobium TaxID=165695 RepID=UPI0013EDFEFC|nr:MULTISPECIES: hypothetical protein [Sphingobium]NYI25036.1 hypothetical protein [Sphingobium indicum]CAD7341779.1 hypothetical protein SPHS6_03750 [Sphingobium sp. S6]CAD7341886.1 hypothetical protein SPHS8_03740 [Sphingobium sp. S8]